MRWRGDGWGGVDERPLGKSIFVLCSAVEFRGGEGGENKEEKRNHTETLNARTKNPSTFGPYAFCAVGGCRLPALTL